MYDRDDDDLPQSLSDGTKEAIQELKNTVFLMSGLYKQLEEERSIITTASGQMTHAGKVFVDHVKKFGELDKHVKNSLALIIQHSAEKAATDIAQTVGDKVAAAATEQGQAVIKNLQAAAQGAAAQLSAYQQQQQESFYWRWAGFIGIALLSGFISAFTLHYSIPEQPFTQEQIKQLDAGKVLINAWGKLDKKERQKLLKLGKG